MHRLLGLILAAGFVAGPALAESPSPIFGHAAVQATTPSENRNIVGKGYYADLFGYYGNYYSAYASLYGTLGFYTKNYNYYNSAYSYANSAASYYYDASYFQARGL